MISLDDFNERVINEENIPKQLTLNYLRKDVKTYKKQRNNYPSDRIKELLPDIDDQDRWRR